MGGPGCCGDERKAPLASFCPSSYPKQIPGLSSNHLRLTPLLTFSRPSSRHTLITASERRKKKKDTHSSYNFPAASSFSLPLYFFPPSVRCIACPARCFPPGLLRLRLQSKQSDALHVIARYLCLNDIITTPPSQRNYRFADQQSFGVFCIAAQLLREWDAFYKKYIAVIRRGVRILRRHGLQLSGPAGQ